MDPKDRKQRVLNTLILRKIDSFSHTNANHLRALTFYQHQSDMYYHILCVTYIYVTRIFGN
mgnify:CR=1 FL=1